MPRRAALVRAGSGWSDHGWDAAQCRPRPGSPAVANRARHQQAAPKRVGKQHCRVPQGGAANAAPHHRGLPTCKPHIRGGHSRGDGGDAGRDRACRLRALRRTCRNEKSQRLRSASAAGAPGRRYPPPRYPPRRLFLPLRGAPGGERPPRRERRARRTGARAAAARHAPGRRRELHDLQCRRRRDRLRLLGQRERSAPHGRGPAQPVGVGASRDERNGVGGH